MELATASDAGTTIMMPIHDMNPITAVGAVSDSTLAGSVLELAQTLTKNNAVLRERSEEKERLSKIIGEFRKHLTWQAQRTQQLQRNLERLHNETNWLSNKSDEVRQDTNVVQHELRQVQGELSKLKATHDVQQEELHTIKQELKVEHDAVHAMNELCVQAHKALLAHTKERDAWKHEADTVAAECRKLKDRLEAMAYKVNGLQSSVVS